MNRNRKVLLLVSIVAAVCIFSAYMVTGMLNQPLTITKTTIMDTVSWEIDRPRSGVFFMNVDEVGNSFNYSDLVIHVGATPVSYAEDAIGEPYNGADGIMLSMNLEAVAKSSYPELFNCTFHVNDANSSIAIGYYDFDDHNCSVVSQRVFGTVEREANIVLAASGTSCSDTLTVAWIFYDQPYIEHRLNVSVECIYKSGSANERVIFPMVFSVVPDAGNGFSDAENISFGTYNRTIGNIDVSDFFAIGLSSGQKINVSVTPPYDTSIEYSLFDPNHVIKQQEEVNSTSVFMFDVDATGTWYIEVQQLRVQGHISEGQYSIAIMEER